MFKPKLMRCFLFTSASNIIDINMMVQVSVFKFGSFAGILFVSLLFLLFKDSVPKQLMPKTPVEPAQFSKKMSLTLFKSYIFTTINIRLILHDLAVVCSRTRNSKFYFEPEATDLFKIWHDLTSAHSRNIHIN